MTTALLSRQALWSMSRGYWSEWEACLELTAEGVLE